MAERFRFFDSIDGEDERFYTADEFAEYFRQFIRNGIFNGGENLKVGTGGKDMKVFINPGYAWIEGYLYKIDTEPLILEHSIADPELNRIDRVIIRLDKSLEKRYVRAFILKGTPEEEPVPPKLTRNDNIYEISLAEVQVFAGKSFIDAHQITDERLNNEVCGLVTHLFEQVDTVKIFNEWLEYLKAKKIESDKSFDNILSEWHTWVNETQPKLVQQFSEWFEGIIENAEVDVDAFTSAFNAWFAGIKQQYDNWFKDIEGGTYITYEKLDDDIDVDEEGKVSIKSHSKKEATQDKLGHVRISDILKQTHIEDLATNEKYQWGIENGIVFLEKVVN